MDSVAFREVSLPQNACVRTRGTYSGRANSPLLHNPAQSKTQVYFGTNETLRSRSDPYFRSVDLRLPDFWRYTEWKREFDQFVKAGNLPSLTLMMLSGDHMGTFDKAIDGVNTPETQMADNDYAVGLIVEAVAHSPFSNDTLVVALEDDAWNGFDHVSAMRSPIYIAGPYVKQAATVSIRYNTVSVLRTLGELLGSSPINVYDATAAPMSDVFDLNAANWSFRAIVPPILRTTSLPLPAPNAAQSSACLLRATHSASYWAKVGPVEGADGQRTLPYETQWGRSSQRSTRHANSLAGCAPARVPVLSESLFGLSAGWTQRPCCNANKTKLY